MIPAVVLALCFIGLMGCIVIVAVALLDALVKRDDKRRSTVGWRTLESINRTHPHGS